MTKKLRLETDPTRTVQRSALCRSRRELSKEYLLAKFGFDTAENEPCKVCPLSVYRPPRYLNTKIFRVRPGSASFTDALCSGKLPMTASCHANISCVSDRLGTALIPRAMPNESKAQNLPVARTQHIPAKKKLGPPSTKDKKCGRN